jgi:spore coat protein U-like protein
MPINDFLAARRRGRRALAVAWTTLIAVLACLAIFAPLRAHAAADCSVTVTGVAFGAYDPTISAPDDSTGTVTVTCNYTGGGASGISYSVAFSRGSSNSYALRQMRAGTLSLNYNLYSDSARSVVLGDGTGGTSIFSGSFTVGPGVGNGTRTGTHTVYGRAPALQPVDPGSYSDPIVVTLTF